MSAVAERTRCGDWTIDDRTTCAPIRWRQWAEETIEAIRTMDRSVPFDGQHAIDMLRAIAEYLDAQYDMGYDGIALTPREDFTLTFDH